MVLWPLETPPNRRPSQHGSPSVLTPLSLQIQLGPVMEAYYDPIASFISLFRALFGDFDIDEIMNNSSGES